MNSNVFGQSFKNNVNHNQQLPSNPSTNQQPNVILGSTNSFVQFDNTNNLGGSLLNTIESLNDVSNNMIALNNQINRFLLLNKDNKFGGRFSENILNWIEKMETAFQSTFVPETLKVAFVRNLLIEDAEK